MRPDDERYFGRIEDRLDEALDRAERARTQGKDPATEIEIPVARDMADRVENILGIPDVAERVRELEEEMSREEAALELVSDFVDGNVGDYDSREGKVEGAVRTAVALLTEGVVAAPIEGIDRVELLENDDGTEFVNVYYAGPIRSAGGTAQALSVLVADYARSLLGIEEYRARTDEVERYAEEVALYDKETGLQYSPKDKETKFIAEHMPIMLDGEATGDEEVSGFRDLERVDTNSARGGMCLVLAEGIALKAPKIQRYTRQLDEVDWPWLQDLIDGTYDADGDADDAGEEAAAAASDAEADAGPDADGGLPDDADSADAEGPVRPDPATKYLRDLIAGRPVFGHPSESGGFRLRYGRSRNHGFATAGVHPATMHLVDDFLATGTQIKTERPGKAAGVVPVDSIEGPTVRLANGDVRRVDDPEEALEIRNGVEEILDLGEYLVNFGEFVENNHPLVPAAYVVEWWVQDLEAAGADVQAMRDDPHVDLEHPDAETALAWAEEYDCPLHPEYTYVWHDVTVAEYDGLADAVAAGDVIDGLLVVEHTDRVRRTLETLLVEHSQTEDALRIPDFRPLLRSLGVGDDLRREWDLDDLSDRARNWGGEGGGATGANAIEAVNEVAPFRVRERAPTRIGNRMGRPEKSESRDLSPAVHTLFPIGDAGGSQRDVTEAANQRGENGRGRVDVLLGDRECPDCSEHTFKSRCPDCGAHTEPHFECEDCGIEAEPDESGRVECPRCEREVESPEWHTVDLGTEYRDALDSIGEREGSFQILKGVKGLMSTNRTPEAIEKGVLRAKHGVTSFKDGTVRYDMTDLPVTSVRPAELDVTADHFRQLGYEADVDGEPLRHDDQLIELKVQDIVLSDGAAEHMMKTADFIDDLLQRFYGLDPFYEVNERDDLVGELVFGMAPHTSAATVGRVVGFTSAAVGYAHPYFHAAKRRNCFHPETKVWFRDEAGDLHHETIETLVEDRLDPEMADSDDFGTLVEDLDGDVFVPAVDGEGEMHRKPVEAVSKHVAPDNMVRVETRSGREITVTPDHEMHVFEDGALVSKRASQVGVADHVVKPAHLDVLSPSERRQEFDLLEEYVALDSIDDSNLMVKGLEKDALYDLFTQQLADEWEGQFYPLQSTADHLDLTKKRLSNYLYRESVPVSLLLEFFDTAEDLLEFVPAHVTLGMKRDRTEIDRFVELNDRVATLLGYYAAEGFAREQDTPKGTIHQTTICGTEAEARSFYVDVLQREFGVEPYEENHAKVTVSGRLLRAFFDSVLEAGIAAETKRVPQPVFDAPDGTVAAFLRGYFSGDGSADTNAVAVSATTVSRELKEDLFALLTRLGIVARAKIHEPRPLSEKFPDYYDPDDPSQTARSYVLHVSSEDAVAFADRVGFHLTRKDEKLQAQIAARTTQRRRAFDGGENDYLTESVAAVEIVESDTEHTYCLTVEGTHSLVANDTSQKQCDGDEDCVMLLMDGLLNFSKSYLPDKRGGSVAEDSRLVAVGPDDGVHFTTFGDFWEKLESPIERDGKFRKKTCYSEEWKTYAFDENHEASLQPIEKAIRYEADDDEQLLRVETQFGRSLDITEHHSLFRYDDGIEEVAGAELEEGDLLVAPRELDVETESTVVDVAECVDDPYVFIDDAVESYLTEIWDAAERGSDTRAAFDGGLSYRLSKNKATLETLNDVATRADVEPEWEPTIGLKGSSTGIDRHVEVNESFAWLLGMFVAEGSLSGVRPTIHNSDEELVDRVVTASEDALGVEPSVRWSNRAYEVAFPAVFRDVLYELGFGAGESHHPSEKHVPDCILRAERSVVEAFIRGYLAGDGSESSDDNHTRIAFHTTSEDVKDGVVFLLHRLGVVANVSHRERDGPRQPIYTVTVSGGATDNPLRRILDGEKPYLPKSLVVSVPDALMKIREMDIKGVKQLVPKYLKRRDNVSLEKLREMVDKLDSRELPMEAERKLDELRPLVDGDLSYLRITNVERVDYDGYLYDLQVGGEPIFTANWLYAHNSMDAPLVMSSRIDPSEIDDEAHNMDIVRQYPREFYEATLTMEDPGEVEDRIQLGEDTLGTDDEYRGFDHTHDTSDIALGPALSAYKTLENMQLKMDAQLELARKLRAVDETDVAERIIEYHFLPDLIGNLRAFSRQETRCLDCGEKYRRMPLTGDCRECGGRMTLTVHQGSVNKYMDTATTVAEEFGCRPYTKQRLEVLEQSLESVFENDKNKQSGIADFF